MKLYVGIDVGKTAHVAAFLNETLLTQRRRFNACPILKFGQDRTGINALLKQVQSYGAKPQDCAVLMESTGHYHKPLLETLQAEGFECYIIAVHEKRQRRRNKTDEADARRLANLLYGQIGLGHQEDEITRRVSRRLSPTPTAASLGSLMRIHYEHTQQRTRITNKLTAICDEIFPELTQIFVKPNLPTALAMRQSFPTPAHVAAATFEQLCAIRIGQRPSDTQLLQLQELARQSIGIKDQARLHGLLLEQEQLIESLLLLGLQMGKVETEIYTLLEESREGQILLSLPGIGPLHAAVILSGLGNIRNFAGVAQLRDYAGWSPRSQRSGTSEDHDSQTPTGNRLLKLHIYLAALGAIKHEPFRSSYSRLVQAKCSYNARTKRYQGKLKVVGTMAGRLCGLIFALLKEDARIIDATPAGTEPPPPRLYSAEVHQEHCRGGRIPPRENAS